MTDPRPFPPKVAAEFSRLTGAIRELGAARQNFLMGYIASLDLPENATVRVDFDNDPAHYVLEVPEQDAEAS